MGLGDRGLGEGGGHGAVVVSEKMFVYSRCADERVARRKIGGARNTACRRMDQLSNIGAGCNRRRRRTGRLAGEGEDNDGAAMRLKRRQQKQWQQRGRHDAES